MFKTQAESSSDRVSSDALAEETWKRVSQPSASEFLARLRRLGLKVWSEEGKLRVSAPPGVLTQELRDELTRRTPEILQCGGDPFRDRSSRNRRDGCVAREGVGGFPAGQSARVTTNEHATARER